MAVVVITPDKKPRYAENLFPYESTLNLPLTVNVSGGGTNGTPEIVSNAPKFNRLNSIRVIFTDTGVLTFDIGSALTFTAPQTGNYVFSCEIFVPTDYDAFTVEGKIATFVNSAPSDFDFSTTDDLFVFGTWNTFTQVVQLTAGDVFECEIKIESNEIGVRAYMGGFSMVYDDRQLNGTPPIYREPYNVISNSATLNFGSIASNDFEDLTIALTGAKLGDAVQLGHPPLTSDHYFFIPFVSADNVVTVRCINNAGGSVDPASGTFNVKIAR